jgi:hypothetical protein
MVGRDANVATNGGSDGKLGFNFTSVAGGCVQDNVTGLMWEVKTADFLPGLRDWTNTYTNYSAAYNPSGFYGTATDAIGFVTAVNATNLCGFIDWRLPTADELHSIVDYGVPPTGPSVPTIDATWFPNTPGGMFWSATEYVGIVGLGRHTWAINFNDGTWQNLDPLTRLNVRLVRAGPKPFAARYTVSADGQEVTDNYTNLIWQRCSVGMSWNNAASPTPTCEGVAHRLSQQDALVLSAATGVWRLPNVKELASIVALGTGEPAVDPNGFPGTPSDPFWSASPDYRLNSHAWLVNFFSNGVFSSVRSSPYYVRLVRAGP